MYRNRILTGSKTLVSWAILLKLLLNVEKRRLYWILLWVYEFPLLLLLKFNWLGYKISLYTDFIIWSGRLLIIYRFWIIFVGQSALKCFNILGCKLLVYYMILCLNSRRRCIGHHFWIMVLFKFLLTWD